VPRLATYTAPTGLSVTSEPSNSSGGKHLHHVPVFGALNTLLSLHGGDANWPNSDRNSREKG
jgi:hypothetical protein